MVVLQVFSPEVKQAHETNHSPPPSAKVKNVWSFLSRPAKCPDRMLFRHKDNFTFTFTLSSGTHKCSKLICADYATCGRRVAADILNRQLWTVDKVLSSILWIRILTASHCEHLIRYEMLCWAFDFKIKSSGGIL
jgi:hypothetical protein